MNFEAEADGVYSYGTNSTGAEIDSFTDPLNLTDTIYVYNQAGVGTSGDFEAEEGDEFFVTENTVLVLMMSSGLMKFVLRTWKTSVWWINTIHKLSLKVA